MGYPIVGDKLYGRKRRSTGPNVSKHPVLDHFPRQALHARKLTVVHVRSGKRLEFHAAIPNDLGSLLGYLRALSGARAQQDCGKVCQGVDKHHGLK
jgi:23S rRNA pseudouridine1911/1915/1917 synthase